VRRRAARFLVAAAVVVPLATTACGRAGGNPVLGDWELDRGATGASAVVAAETTDLIRITFRGDAIAAGDTVIPVTWIVEGERVRAVRGDGRGEHAIERLPDGRIQVELPIGVTAVYREAQP
jgi:hypothetical protein